MAVKMARELARAIATDAGNVHMRGEHRKTWNAEDFDVAAVTFNRLWPEELDHADQDA